MGPAPGATEGWAGNGQPPAPGGAWSGMVTVLRGWGRKLRPGLPVAGRAQRNHPAAERAGHPGMNPGIGAGPAGLVR